MEKGRFWGTFSRAACTVPGAAAGTAKGVYDAASGTGTFTGGFRETREAVGDAAYRFGAEHSDQITGAVISAVVGRIVRSVDLGHH